MNVKDYLKKELQVPENWDKHDYEIPRYTFGDIEDVLQKVVSEDCNFQNIANVVGRSELLIDFGNKLSKAINGTIYPGMPEYVDKVLKGNL